MVNPCHQPYYHSKVWYGRTTPSDESSWISCSPNCYCWSITLRNFTVLYPTLIAWRLKTPSFDRFSATLRTNRLRMEARTTETETMLSTDFNVSTLHRMSVNKARMAPSIIGSHSRFSNACYGCPNFRLRKTNLLLHWEYHLKVFNLNGQFGRGESKRHQIT